MTVNEAMKILDLNPGYNKDELKKHYRDAIKLNHPDIGGTKEAAERINQAKEILEDNINNFNVETGFNYNTYESYNYTDKDDIDGIKYNDDNLNILNNIIFNVVKNARDSKATALVFSIVSVLVLNIIRVIIATAIINLFNLNEVLSGMIYSVVALRVFGTSIDKIKAAFKINEANYTRTSIYYDENKINISINNIAGETRNEYIEVGYVGYNERKKWVQFINEISTKYVRGIVINNNLVLPTPIVIKGLRTIIYSNIQFVYCTNQSSEDTKHYVLIPGLMLTISNTDIKIDKLDTSNVSIIW